MTRFAAALVVAVLAFAPAQAGKFNKVVSIGDKAPTFEELVGVDDEKHSLSDYTKDVVVICITCNHCPVAVAYEDRMIDFVKKYGEQVDFVAINVNNLEADKLPKMKERAAEKGFNFPYLYDESQKIGSALGATVTPEFFVLNKDREIVYMGAMDDAQRNPTEDHLSAAVEAVLKGETPELQETKARGCGVKYE